MAGKIMQLENLDLSEFDSYLNWFREYAVSNNHESGRGAQAQHANPLGLKVGDIIRVKNPPPIPMAKVLRFRLDGTPVVRWTHADHDVALIKPEMVERVDDAKEIPDSGTTT